MTQRKPVPSSLRLLILSPCHVRLSHLRSKFLSSGRLRPFLPDCADYLTPELVALMYRADPRMLRADGNCVLVQATRYGQLDVVRWIVDNAMPLDITPGWTCYTYYDPESDELIAEEDGEFDDEDDFVDFYDDATPQDDEYPPNSASSTLTQFWKNHADVKTLYSQHSLAGSTVYTHSPTAVSADELAKKMPIQAIPANDSLNFTNFFQSMRDALGGLVGSVATDDSTLSVAHRRSVSALSSQRPPSRMIDCNSPFSGLPLTPMTPHPPTQLSQSRAASKQDLDALPILNPQSAVHLAVRFNHPVILQLLLQSQGQDVYELLRTRDPLGLLAHDAARRHHWDCLKILISNGAIASFRIPNERSVWEEVLLADSRGEADLFQVWSWLCLEQPESIDFDAALRLAARHGNLQACRVLVEDVGLDVSSILMDGFRCTAHLPTLEYLLKNGLCSVDPNTNRRDSRPFIHELLADPDSRSLAHVQLAVAHGAPIRVTGENAGDLQYAVRALRDTARWGCVDILAWLCEVAGISLLTRPKLAADVFSAALRYGQWKVVRYLLRRVPIADLLLHFVGSEVRTAKGIPVRLGRKLRLNTATDTDDMLPDLPGGVETEDDAHLFESMIGSTVVEEADLYISFNKKGRGAIVRLRAGLGAVRVTNGALRRLLRDREQGVLRCVREVVAWCADRWDGCDEGDDTQNADELDDYQGNDSAGKVTYWLEDTLAVEEFVHQGAGGMRF